MMPAVTGTVREALTSATEALAAAGVETPRLDAELMLAEATATGRASLVASPDAGVQASAARRFGDMVRRRVRREPVAYILGRRGFRHLELAVDPRVLVPRPETELLVELALAVGPATVLDIGTGSGAVELAIADELPNAEVTATDASLDALAVAQANRDRLGFAARLELEHGTLPARREFDLVLANLPYVAADHWPALAPEIAAHEPYEALVPGPTGLEAIEALLGQVSVGELEAGAIGLEVGAGQAPAVAELVRRAGFERVRAVRDLAGIERVVAGER
jgi:release factor glutamine methyltransferase